MKTMGVTLQQANSVAAGLFPFDLNSASRDPLNSLASPGRRIEGVREILCLMYDLAIAGFHNADGVCWPPLVGDRVFGYPEITFSENSLDVQTHRFAGMMIPQGL